ncbi:hypothetical protein FraQA3DRAFT_6178 [Frankia sp. QA3]|nr:hypothetical protein FraQA3DRAFT_6178 [Frankia sp. QA3]
MMTESAVPRRRLPNSPFKVPALPAQERFAVGDRVTHDVYGLGRVIGVTGETSVDVDFGSRQERIPSPFSRMYRL